MKTIPVSLVFAGSLLGAYALPGPDRPEGAPAPQERPGTPGGGEERRGGQRQPIEFWMHADTNGDGLISRDEFLALERIKNLPEEKRDRFFNRLDKNGDGSVSIEELRKLAEGEKQGGFQGLPRLPELDTDHSGGVSLEEFKASPFVQKLPAERQDALFKRLDRDGDGQITPKDRPEGPPRRPDGPGRDDQGRGGDDPRQLLRRLDANGDGAVTFEEFQKAPFAEKLGEDALEERFMKLDKNGDKRLTQDDMPPPPEGGKPPEKPERPGPPPGPKPE